MLVLFVSRVGLALLAKFFVRSFWAGLRHGQATGLPFNLGASCV